MAESTPKGYTTLDEAVYRGAIAARKRFKNKVEAMSVVYEKDGKFFVTDPATMRESDGSVKIKVRIPKGSLRYVIHNHPEFEDSDMLSADDVNISNQLGVPSAIIFGESPVIRTYTPGKTDTKRLRGVRRNLGKVSDGDEFNYTPLPLVSPPNEQEEIQDLRRLVQAKSLSGKKQPTPIKVTGQRIKDGPSY